MNKKRVFMIGMPSSGKTTFLASLCRLLLHGEQETEWSLDISDVPEGLENIKKMIKNLDSYREVGRTLESAIYNVELNLYNQYQEWIQFVVPDLSGEIYQNLVYDRRISFNIMDQIAKSDVLLFFINFNTMIPEERIKLNEESAIQKLNQEQGNDNQKCIETEEPKVKKYNDQSALVELLQSIIYLVPHSLNIRFVVSAWDLVEKAFKVDKLTPERYIKRKLPLLYQYLMCNTEKFSYEIWGASAQGGDFNNKEDLQRLQRENGENFVYVVDNKASISNDLTKLL